MLNLILWVEYELYYTLGTPDRWQWTSLDESFTNRLCY